MAWVKTTRVEVFGFKKDLPRGWWERPASGQRRKEMREVFAIYRN
jgi:hypothetical protein